jgi:hypothetical protein
MNTVILANPAVPGADLPTPSIGMLHAYSLDEVDQLIHALQAQRAMLTKITLTPLPEIPEPEIHLPDTLAGLHPHDLSEGGGS